ncbi:hypothetical protein Agabi119p4_4953 [Agaricus bisporus var. burnettii]|uniref:Uncharacterized protein n=1 Tax=Agaricus bisporus var. burnettii TaxID=192524 RepID=A0A8H7F4D4_AGABI|nr:hypothetical protein Agabi119p4_4953 [Agaricus bisporus var. burnettii]
MEDTGQLEVLTMDVSSQELDNMICDAVTGSCPGTPLDANDDIEGEGEGSKKPRIRRLDEGQGESKSAKKRQRRQVKVEEAQLHQLYEERKAELSARKRAKVGSSEDSAAAKGTDGPQLNKTDLRNLRRSKKRSAVESKGGFLASKKAISAVAQRVGELQLPINMEKVIQGGTQRGAYRPLSQPLDADVQERMDEANTARAKGVFEDPVAVLAGLKAKDYRVVKWDGIRPIALVDRQGRIFAVLAGQPPEKTWAERCMSLFNIMSDESERAKKLETKYHNHGRGFYPSIASGITFAPGYQHPHNLSLSPTASRLVDNPTRTSLENNCQRFAESAMDVFAPNLFRYYQHHIQLLEKNHNYGHLRHNLQGGIYTSKSSNYPPRAYTAPHRDVMNLAFGWCAVFALGSFDATHGGHLVIHNLRIAIEFPHASCILLPSSILWHSNVPIASGEQRASLTFYTPGCLFRFIDNHFFVEKNLEKVHYDEWRRLQEEKIERKSYACDFYSTVQEIVSRVK